MEIGGGDSGRRFVYRLLCNDNDQGGPDIGIGIEEGPSLTYTVTWSHKVRLAAISQHCDVYPQQCWRSWTCKITPAHAQSQTDPSRRAPIPSKRVKACAADVELTTIFWCPRRFVRRRGRARAPPQCHPAPTCPRPPDHRHCHLSQRGERCLCPLHHNWHTTEASCVPLSTSTWPRLFAMVIRVAAPTIGRCADIVVAG